MTIELGSSWSLGSAWHLDRLVVENMRLGTKYTFECAAWLSGKAGKAKTWSAQEAAEGQVQGLRLAAQQSATAAGTGSHAEGLVAAAVEVPYRLVIATSNKLGAGTDAKVHLEFVDAAGARCASALNACAHRLLSAAAVWYNRQSLPGCLTHVPGRDLETCMQLGYSHSSSEEITSYEDFYR